MTTYTWDANAVTADWTDTSEWSVGGLPVDTFPVEGDAAWIGAGTADLDIAQVYNTTVTLFRPEFGVTADNVEIVAAGVDLGDRTVLLTASLPTNLGSIVYDVVGSGTLDDSNSRGLLPQPGSIDFATVPLTIDLTAISATGPVPTFTNAGAISGAALLIALGAATSSGTFLNDTTLDITGPLAVAAGVTLGGTGIVDLDGFEASAAIAGAVGAGQTFEFINGPAPGELGGTLTIANDAQFLGVVDLDASHQIMLPAALVSGPTTFPSGAVTLTDGSTLDIVPIGDTNAIQAFSIPASVNSLGETFLQAIEVVPPCFCAGTRIATQAGDVPVEHLRAGDAVRLAGGGTARVVWVGERAVRCDRHPRPHDVWPVCIRAGAVGPGVPRRDLLLSPDHAVRIAGHLIPVRHLLNGASIVQEPVAWARYHHVELARHDLLLAEALAAESYLDTGNRAAFGGGGPALLLHPDFARRVWADCGCAPLVEAGTGLIEARRTLLRRAARLGHRRTRDPALRVLADSFPLRPAPGEGWHFDLPPGTRAVRLASRIWVPAQMHPDEADPRRLGVALGQLWLDGREVSLASPALAGGWHAPEPAGRWTDGDARLMVNGARTLAFKLAMVGSYWREPAPARRNLRSARARPSAVRAPGTPAR